MSKKQFAVIGIGQFGEAIAKSLSKKGAEVLAIDANQERIDYISSEVSYAVALDATDKKALLMQNIQEFDAVVISIGEQFEQLLLCAVNLIELKVKRIIARAKGDANKLILQKLGIEEIFQPEFEVGALVAERLMNPSIVSYLQLPDGYSIAEIEPPQAIIGRTLGDIKLRDNYRINLITVKRDFEVEKDGEKITESHLTGVPQSTTVIENQDNMLIFGKESDIQKFIEINR
jgi:trk system potassium uptake protein TrkA